MARDKVPMTAALRALRDAGVTFETHAYAYEERGGTAASARALGVDEHAVVKTLVFEDPRKRPLLVLMHGDREVSAKALAAAAGVERLVPSDERDAERHTGYRFGGTSPFGTRRPLPVYLERSILDLPRLWVNGGRRGLLVSMAPADLERALSPVLVDVARPS